MATTKSPRKSNAYKPYLKAGLFIIVIVAVYFGASAYFNARNHFTYEGLKFTIENWGDTKVYHYYYYIQVPNKGLLQYNLYLLNDPRTNPVPLSGDPILFDKPTVYVSLDTNFPVCKENAAALIDLSQFLVQNQLTVKRAFTNKTYAGEHNESYVTCENSPRTEVIELISGNETRIDVKGNCHRITIGPDCLIREASEKFRVETVAEARRRHLVI